MTDAPKRIPWQDRPESTRRIKKRYRAQKRFKMYGLGAILIALAMLAVLLVSIVGKGYPAFVSTKVALEVHFDASIVDPDGTRDVETMAKAKYAKLLRNTLFDAFPDVKGRKDKRALLKLISNTARFELRDLVLNDPSIIGTKQRVWLTAGTDLDLLHKGQTERDVPEEERRLNDKQISWVEALEARGDIKGTFNTGFFVNSDSREPEAAGIGGALVGSLFTLLITLALAFPIGVTTAIYLEEFAPKNRFTDFIEVNINNLAAVPSIVFGLLGLAIFIQVFHLPRSAPIVGGLTLMLMTLPIIIIATRAALKAVPPSIREAAYGVGASPIQVVSHHVLPLAMPGVLTGTIIGMAHALGETAPLLMIGMVAFIVDTPGSPMDAATVLPVQVFLWADSPERGFVEKTSAAIMVLLAFLVAMNALAIYLRQKFEIRW
jgi:phosphate transport system permease protein